MIIIKRRQILTAVKIPLDLMKLDSDAASLRIKPSNLSFDASPIDQILRILMYKNCFT